MPTTSLSAGVPACLPPFASAGGRSARCVVCAGMVRPGLDAADPYPTCHAVACRMVVSRRDEMGETPFRFYLQRHVQQQRALAAAAARAVGRRAQEGADNARVWALLGAAVRMPAAPLRLVVPSGPARSGPLRVARKARYLAHLRAVAKLAAALAPGAVPGPDDVAVAASAQAALPAAQPAALPGLLCALCGGGCCTRGADHAYLSPPTLRRFMDAQPQLSATEVVAAYVARMPAAPRIGSCINHTRTGCSLPRAMRSDICNDFACTALRQLEGAPAAQVVLVVRRTQDLWQRDRTDLDNAVNGAAVLRETGVRRVTVKPSGAV